jgi:hypothetical protein
VPYKFDGLPWINGEADLLEWCDSECCTWPLKSQDIETGIAASIVTGVAQEGKKKKINKSVTILDASKRLVELKAFGENSPKIFSLVGLSTTIVRM